MRLIKIGKHYINPEGLSLVDVGQDGDVTIWMLSGFGTVLLGDEAKAAIRHLESNALDLTPGGPCHMEGCTEPATARVCVRFSDGSDGGPTYSTPYPFCERHAGDVLHRDSPETITDCPHCKVTFGIG